MKRKNISLIISCLILGIMALAAIFCKQICPYDPNAQDLTSSFIPPFSQGHILGTDNLGRDILCRIIYGARISLFVGIVGTVIGFAVGVALGIVSGYFGGIIDTVIMRVGDIQLAFPFTLLAIAIIAVLGAGVKNIIIVAVITGWIKYARVVRSDVLAVKKMEYIQACKSLGLSHLRIMKHIFPNVIPAAIITATLETGRIILMESTLSFLGMGVPTNVPAWGSMLSAGRTYIMTQPWLCIFPGMAICLVILSVNMIGDWLRVFFDPKAE